MSHSYTYQNIKTVFNIYKLTRETRGNSRIHGRALCEAKSPMSLKHVGRRVTLTQGLDKEVINLSLLKEFELKPHRSIK